MKPNYGMIQPPAASPSAVDECKGWRGREKRSFEPCNQSFPWLFFMDGAITMKRFIWNRHTKLVLKHVLGWMFIAFGIAGLFLPVLQGILFLIIGSLLLADHIPFFAKIRDWLHHRFPRTAEYVHGKREHFRKKFRKKNKPNSSVR